MKYNKLQMMNKKILKCILHKPFFKHSSNTHKKPKYKSRNSSLAADSVQETGYQSEDTMAQKLFLWKTTVDESLRNKAAVLQLQTYIDRLPGNISIFFLCMTEMEFILKEKYSKYSIIDVHNWRP